MATASAVASAVEKIAPTIKTQLFQVIQQSIDQRVVNAQKAIKSVEDSKSTQTKSSAGDKFETGRAMMQAAEERHRVQLSKALALQNDLKQVNRFTNSDTAVRGSLVITNKGAYFLSVGIGKIKLADKPYFAISLASPIGQLLFGKKVGDKINFRGNEIVIIQIT